MVLTKKVTASADPATIICAVVVGRRDIGQRNSLGAGDLLVALGDCNLSALLEAEGLAKGVAHLRRGHFRAGAHSVGSTPRDSQACRAILVGDLTYVADFEADLVKCLWCNVDSESSIETGRCERADDETEFPHVGWFVKSSRESVDGFGWLH